MKIYFNTYIIILFFLSRLSFGQNDSLSQSDLDSLLNISIQEETCGYYNSGLKQENTFPFNISDKVELLSFSSRDYNIQDIVVKGKLLLTTIKQRKIITKTDIDTLFNKIYNYKSNRDIRDNSLTLSSSFCYDPHHAIIFYKNKKPIAYIEICFKCTTYKTSKGSIWFSDCSEKYEYFEGLFRNNGLTYMLN